MKAVWKWTAAALLAGAALCATTAVFAEAGPSAGKAAAAAAGPMRPRTQLTMEEMEIILSQKYFLTPEEARAHLEAGVNFRDLERAALYSYVTGKTVDEILAVKKDETWQRTAYLIGAVGQRMYDRQLEWKAENLHRWWGIDRGTALRYLREGWPMHYVKIAWVIAGHTDWTMEAVLADRKYTESWKDWCARRLGVSGETYDKWISAYVDPAYFPGKYF